MEKEQLKKIMILVVSFIELNARNVYKFNDRTS